MRDEDSSASDSEDDVLIENKEQTHLQLYFKSQSDQEKAEYIIARILKIMNQLPSLSMFKGPVYPIYEDHHVKIHHEFLD